MVANEYKIVDNGDSAITIIFKQQPSEVLTRKIIALERIISLDFDNKLHQIIPSYQSITLCFNPLKLAKNELINQLNKLLSSSIKPSDTPSKLIKIPVCYQPNFAPDLSKVAERTGLSIDKIVSLHTSTKYLVHMLGFLPGFLYLGGLDKRLYSSRKKSPRNFVPSGSVGIGGKQTGIYPVDSPGGWQIIGRTPLKLFDPNSDYPAIARPLDRIQFVSITTEKFKQLDSANLGTAKP